MTTPFANPHSILLSRYEVGSTSKEASSKTLTKEATQAETALEAEQYYQATHLMSLFGYKAPSGKKPPTTLKQAITDVETDQDTLTGWTAPPSPSPTPLPSTPTIPWWVYAIIGAIVIMIIVAIAALVV